MGQLLELCESELRGIYWPLMSPSNQRAPEILARLAEISVELSDLEQLLKLGWRDQIVAGVASLFHPDPQSCLPLVWGAFDSGSWASPQLGVCAMLLSPQDPSEAQRRVLLRCPVYAQHLEGTDPMWRHVNHGSAAIQSHSTKAMAALLETLARSPQGRAWLTSHLAFEEAFWALESDFWDQGEDISRSFSNPIGPLLSALGRSVPDWLCNDSPADLLGMWDLKAQPAAVRCLCAGPWDTRIARFFEPFARAGHHSLILEGNGQQLRVLSRTLDGNQLLLQLNGPYYEALWARLEFDTRGSGVLVFPTPGPGLAGLRVEHLPQGMSIRCLADFQSLPDSERSTLFELTERPLEECPAQLWIFGIDDQARFDGGVAAKVAEWGGEELIESVRLSLAEGDRGPGQVVLATSAQLRQRGVYEVACLITLPQPDLAQLCQGLEWVLQYAHNRHWRLALVALGCGAAGFKAKDVAGPLLAVLAPYRESFKFTLSLPRDSDRSAFLAAARSQGLLADKSG
ncbi:MAG: hypothetical protein U0931_37260 [Vulcanimicrobiota bacterium]